MIYQLDIQTENAAIDQLKKQIKGYLDEIKYLETKKINKQEDQNMFLIIPIIAGALIGAVAPMIISIAGTVGGLIVARVVLKASSNAVALLKDGKIGLDVQKFVKKISDCDEQIGNIIIENNLEFENEMFTKKLKKLKTICKNWKTKKRIREVE